jgi:hypothetical protein
MRAGIVGAMALLACGGGRIRTPPLRDVTTIERDRIASTLPAGPTLLEARALGDPLRIVGVYAAADASAPRAIDALCGATARTPITPEPGCTVVTLARWNASADAIDARWALALSCPSANEPAAAALGLEIADLDGDGGAELAIAFDARPAPNAEPVHVARVVDATTFAVQLAEDIGDVAIDSSTPPTEDRDGPIVSATESRTAATLVFERLESGEGSALLITTESPAEERQLGQWYRRRSFQFQVGPRRETYDFTDDHDEVRRVPYDRTADCWRTAP